MNRFERVAGRATLFLLLGLAATVLMVPLGAWSVNRPALVPTVASIAAQLGVKVAERESDEFLVGVQFSGTLKDTTKLPAFGLKGFSVGARVTAARIAENRVHIEADALDPPRTEFVRVRIDADGKIVAPMKP